MTIPLFLFCGGPSVDHEGHPKPLMRVDHGRTLLECFLVHLPRHRQELPASITLLCDDGQEDALERVVATLAYPLPITVSGCGPASSTLEKFEHAVGTQSDPGQPMQFGYPDIFHFGSFPTLSELERSGSNSIVISAAPLTSRFPRLIIDVYSTVVQGISNYQSAVPANPMHVFAGDLWGHAGPLRSLLQRFRVETATVTAPSLEYDFFFWLINQKQMRSVMLFGDRVWVDSMRDVRTMLTRLDAA